MEIYFDIEFYLEPGCLRDMMEILLTYGNSFHPALHRMIDLVMGLETERTNVFFSLMDFGLVRYISSRYWDGSVYEFDSDFPTEKSNKIPQYGTFVLHSSQTDETNESDLVELDQSLFSEKTMAIRAGLTSDFQRSMIAFSIDRCWITLEQFNTLSFDQKVYIFRFIVQQEGNICKLTEFLELMPKWVVLMNLEAIPEAIRPQKEEYKFPKVTKETQSKIDCFFRTGIYPFLHVPTQETDYSSLNELSF